MAPLNQLGLQVRRVRRLSSGHQAVSLVPLEHPADVEAVIRALFNQPGTEITRIRHAA